MSDLVVPRDQGDLLIVLADMERDGLVDVGEIEEDYYTVTAAGAAWGNERGCVDLPEMCGVYAKEHGRRLASPRRHGAFPAKRGKLRAGIATEDA